MVVKDGHPCWHWHGFLQRQGFIYGYWGSLEKAVTKTEETNDLGCRPSGLQVPHYVQEGRYRFSGIDPREMSKGIIR